MGAGGNLEIDIRPTGDKTIVRLKGLVNELSNFERFKTLEGSVQFHMRGLRRFNSAGVREWVDAIRELTARARVTFVACSPTVVDQLNMIQGFLGKGRVVSFIAPMLCESCDATEDKIFDAAEVRELDRLPKVECPSCGVRMELDDIEDQFLLFLREPTHVGD